MFLPLHAEVHPRGGPERPGPSPWGIPSTRFSGFLPLNYIICIFSACGCIFFSIWEDRASLQNGSELTLGKYNTYTSYWTLCIKNYVRALPLKTKILGAPLSACYQVTPGVMVKRAARTRKQRGGSEVRQGSRRPINAINTVWLLPAGPVPQPLPSERAVCMPTAR